MNSTMRTGIAVRTIHRADPAIIDALGQQGVATVHEAQSRAGMLKPYMRPIYPGARIAGSALTVLCHPGDNWMMHVAMELCQPGDVVVVALTADNTDSMFGELLAQSARARGVRGVVVDASVRDVVDMTEMRFPAWSRGIHAKGAVKSTLGSVNVPVVCAGQLVQPGDVVVADDDGVVIVPRLQAQQVAEAGAERERDEVEKRRRLAAGELGLDLMNMRESLQKAGLRYLDHIDELNEKDS